MTAAIEEIHVADKGTVITFTVQDQGAAVDLSGFTTKTITLQDPGGTVSSAVAVEFVTDGTDGQVKYTTTGTDFDEAGWWKMQLAFSNVTISRKSKIIAIEIHANL